MGSRLSALSPKVSAVPVLTVNLHCAQVVFTCSLGGIWVVLFDSCQVQIRFPSPAPTYPHQVESLNSRPPHHHQLLIKLDKRCHQEVGLRTHIEICLSSHMKSQSLPRHSSGYLLAPPSTPRITAWGDHTMQVALITTRSSLSSRPPSSDREIAMNVMSSPFYIRYSRTYLALMIREAYQEAIGQNHRVSPANVGEPRTGT